MFDVKRFVKSFHYALQGLHYALKHDQNLRFHFIMAFVVIILSLLFHVNAFEMGILGVMIILVITTEMLNSSIEQMVDLITKEHRQEAKIAKDVASGMVLVSALGSIIVGVLIFVPHIVRLFH